MADQQGFSGVPRKTEMSSRQARSGQKDQGFSEVREPLFKRPLKA
jgi:hypothetical protein